MLIACLLLWWGASPRWMVDAPFWNQTKILSYPLQKLAEEQDTNQSMSAELNALKSKLLEIKEQTIIVDDEYEAEKLGWQKVREAMGVEIERLNCDLQVHLTPKLESVSNSPGEVLP